jgi:hypothetical protein
MPLSLTDLQLALVMAAAGPLDPDKGIALMERIVAALKMQGVRRPGDGDIERALREDRRGLVQGAA